MKTLETKRLILRKFTEDDFAEVHSYAGCLENTIYVPWGPNNEEQTWDFIKGAIKEADENKPNKNYIYAAILKESGKLIGDCDISFLDDIAALGWTLHRDYWRQGYGTEMGEAMLKFGFEDLNLHRITAHCDADNYGSYRVMEKIGMRREGLFIEGRPAHKLSDRVYSDEVFYAILKGEWLHRLV